MKKASFDREGALRVARLARLALSEEELSVFAEQLEAILDHVAQLEELDLEGVEGTSHALALECPTRPDQARPSWSRAELLALAPAQDGEFFLVPKIIGQE